MYLFNAGFKTKSSMDEFNNFSKKKKKLKLMLQVILYHFQSVQIAVQLPMMFHTPITTWKSSAIHQLAWKVALVLEQMYGSYYDGLFAVQGWEQYYQIPGYVEGEDIKSVFVSIPQNLYFTQNQLIINYIITIIMKGRDIALTH